jgi:hypothetical protein
VIERTCVSAFKTYSEGGHQSGAKAVASPAARVVFSRMTFDARRAYISCSKDPHSASTSDRDLIKENRTLEERNQMILLKTTVIPAVLYLTLSAATTLHAQERMRPGMWESAVTAASGQTATRSSCFKPANAAMSNGSPAVVRAETEKAMSKSACTLKDFNLDSNTLTLTMVCGTTTTHQETKFHGGDSFETTTTNTVGGVTKVTQIKSRRTGDCKGAE